MGEDGNSLQPGAAQDAWRLQHHALRQPLNALGLFCAALKMQPLSAAQQPLVAGIAEVAQDIERLVDAHFAALAARPAGLAQPALPGPRALPGAQAEAAAHPSRSAPPGEHAPTRPGPALVDTTADMFRSPACRILVVDDDHAARTGLVMLLEAWGASVQSFADIESLERWLSSPMAIRPDLLMLDYHLPRPGDGLIALRLVRQAWPAQPVHTLLITGDRRAAMANALSDGSLECLVKPVLPEPLLATIRQQVGPQFGV
ncbi:MAG: response regulator [Betaproteobacteria bacterium]